DNLRDIEISEWHANHPHQYSQDFERAFRARYDIGLLYPRVANQMRMLAKAINEAKSLEPTKIAAKLEGMKLDVHDGGDGFMRKDDHQFFQPMYIASFGERNDKEPFDEEKTGWGWRNITRLDTASTTLPTTCKMDRPS